MHIEGLGTLRLKITTDNNEDIELHIPNSLFVPSIPMCLISPQSVAQQTNNPLDGFHAKGSYGVFTFSGFVKTVYYNSKNNLPILFTSSVIDSLPSPPSYDSNLPSHVTSLLATEDLSPTSNLSPLQQRLLLKHQQLGHLHMTKIQQLAKDGYFGENSKNLAQCHPPLCKACIHGKQHKRALQPSNFQPIDSEDLDPGPCVSCDQLESTQPGLIPVYRGSSSTSFYNSGTLFVDHASRLLHFTPHTSTGALDAVQAKQCFELFAYSFNQFIRHYHTDNGIFTSQRFTNACRANNQ